MNTEQEVLNFYNMNCKYISPGFFSYGLRKEDPSKFGTSPKRLVAISNPYSEEHLDINKLEYKAVREDCQRRIMLPKEKVKYIAKVDLGVLITGIGATGLAFTGNFLEALVTGVACVALNKYSDYLEMPSPKDQADFIGSELDEFTKLFQAAGFRDLGLVSERKRDS